IAASVDQAQNLFNFVTGVFEALPRQNARDNRAATPGKAAEGTIRSWRDAFVTLGERFSRMRGLSTKIRRGNGCAGLSLTSAAQRARGKCGVRPAPPLGAMSRLGEWAPLSQLLSAKERAFPLTIRASKACLNFAAA